MKLTSPFLNVDELATPDLIEKVVSDLKENPNSFAIISKSEMEYVQVLVTELGCVVQFQNGSLKEHYEFNTYLSRPQTIELFQAYLSGSKYWHGKLQYSKINTGGVIHSLGYWLGRLFGFISK